MNEHTMGMYALRPAPFGRESIYIYIQRAFLERIFTESHTSTFAFIEKLIIRKYSLQTEGVMTVTQRVQSYKMVLQTKQNEE